MTTQEQAQLRILNILNIVTTEPRLNQRQLAERLSISLGKTNYLLNQLISNAASHLVRSPLAVQTEKWRWKTAGSSSSCVCRRDSISLISTKMV